MIARASFWVMGMIWPQSVEMVAQQGEYMEKKTPLNCTFHDGESDVCELYLGFKILKSLNSAQSHCTHGSEAPFEL